MFALMFALRKHVGVRGGRVGWKFCLRGGLAGMPAVNAHNSIPLSCACAARQCSGVRSFLGRRGRFFVAALVPDGVDGTA